MNSHTLFANLRNTLAELYPEGDSARRVVADAGLDFRHIAFSTHAINNWHAILNEAIKINCIDKLIEVTLREYGDNQMYQNILDVYRRFVEQGGRIDLMSHQDIQSSKYKVDFKGNVQGVIIGDGAHVTMSFSDKSPEGG